MAIKDPCEHCGQLLSVPEDMRGRKVRCPSCGNRSLVLTPEDRRGMEDERKRKFQEDRDRERLDLLERIGTIPEAGPAAEHEANKGLADRDGTEQVPVEEFASIGTEDADGQGDPGRDPSDLLALAAYLVPLLALASGLFPLVVEGELGLKLGVLGLCITLGLAGFTLFHGLAELARRMEDPATRELHDHPQHPLPRALPPSARVPPPAPPA